MRIIGHRGASGLALENTMEAIRLALTQNLAGIEFDIRLTKDQQLVLCHDAHLTRISSSSQKISDLTYAELQTMPLKNGEFVPLLSEVLHTVGHTTPLIIEIKADGCAEPLADMLDNYPGVRAIIASRNHGEIARFKTLRPKVPALVTGHTNPFELIEIAKLVKADGLDLNFWLLNPLIYWMARRAKLMIMVYTVNNRIFARFLHVFYPHISICTDYPDRLKPRRRHSRHKTT